MANNELIYRATHELHVDGRTLIGVAMPFDTVARVVDPGPRQRPYLEAFARSAFDKTLTQRPEPRPLYFQHEYLYRHADPIGVAHFERSDKSLDFVAYMSRTRSADERLELIKDGAARDASVGGRPITQKMVRTPEGLVTVRTEVDLRELSIAPTGFAQYPDAKVLALRALTAGEIEDDPGALAQAVDAALDEAIEALKAGDAAQALALMQAADSTIDQLQALLGVPDVGDAADDAEDTTTRSETPSLTPKLEAWRRRRERGTGQI